MNWCEISMSIVGQAIAATFGAGFGAWAAFRFESRKERVKTENERYLAIRFAHFVIMSQYSELLSLKKDYLKDFKNRKDSWWQLKPATIGFTSPKIDYSGLSFILESSDPNLLNRITVGQQKHEAVRNAISIRNDIMIELQRRAAVLNTQGINEVENEEELCRILGNDLITILKDYTKSLFEIHESSISFIKQNLEDTHKLVKKQFPDRKPPEFEEIGE